MVHEWSVNLNEREHSLVLPSNRETGCLSDTRIKMDALYFPPCSVREQGEIGGVKREEEEEWRQAHGGHEERYKDRGSERKTTGSITIQSLAKGGNAFSYNLRQSNRSSGNKKKRFFVRSTGFPMIDCTSLWGANLCFSADRVSYYKYAKWQNPLLYSD